MGDVGENGQFAHEGGDEQASEGVVDIFAVALKSRVNLLFAEMEGISPIDIPIFEQANIRITTVVFLLKDAIIEARIDHK